MNKMDCDKITILLIDYIDLKLDDNTNKAIEEHLACCQKCRTEYQQTKEIFGAIEHTTDQLPEKKLKDAFDQMLTDEKAIQKEPKKRIKVDFLNRYKIVLQVAAAILLIFTGYVVGYNSNNKTTNDEKLTIMQNDVFEMKQMMALSLLKDESASQRIKAVNYTEEIQSPNNEIIDALINTLNTDKNSNVRLAAIYSLARFKNNKSVREALIKTLNKQDDPMVQIVIINLLVEMEDVRALDELKILLQNKNILEEVKKQAEIGVKAFS